MSITEDVLREAADQALVEAYEPYLTLLHNRYRFLERMYMFLAGNTEFNFRAEVDLFYELYVCQQHLFSQEMQTMRAQLLQEASQTEQAAQEQGMLAFARWQILQEDFDYYQNIEIDECINNFVFRFFAAGHEENLINLARLSHTVGQESFFDLFIQPAINAKEEMRLFNELATTINNMEQNLATLSIVGTNLFEVVAELGAIYQPLMSDDINIAVWRLNTILNDLKNRGAEVEIEASPSYVFLQALQSRLQQVQQSFVRLAKSNLEEHPFDEYSLERVLDLFVENPWLDKIFSHSNKANIGMDSLRKEHSAYFKFLDERDALEKQLTKKDLDLTACLDLLHKLHVCRERFRQDDDIKHVRAVLTEEFGREGRIANDQNAPSIFQRQIARYRFFALEAGGCLPYYDSGEAKPSEFKGVYFDRKVKMLVAELFHRYPEFQTEARKLGDDFYNEMVGCYLEISEDKNVKKRSPNNNSENVSSASSSPKRPKMIPSTLFLPLQSIPVNAALVEQPPHELPNPATIALEVIVPPELPMKEQGHSNVGLQL